MTPSSRGLRRYEGKEIPWWLENTGSLTSCATVYNAGNTICRNLLALDTPSTPSGISFLHRIAAVSRVYRPPTSASTDDRVKSLPIPLPLSPIYFLLLSLSLSFTFRPVNLPTCIVSNNFSYSVIIHSSILRNKVVDHLSNERVIRREICF